MSDRLDRLMSYPSTWVMARADDSEPAFSLRCVLVLLTLIGAARGEAGMTWQFLSGIPLWSGLAAGCDLALLALYCLSPRSRARFESDGDTLLGYVLAILNIPLVMASFYIMIDFCISFFAQGFWKDLLGIACALIIQIKLIQATQGPNGTARQRPPLFTPLPNMTRALQGLVPTVGACIYGLCAYLLFRIVSGAFLGDASVALIEEGTSDALFRLEHPFGETHPGLLTWELFVLLFVASFVLVSSPLVAVISRGQRWHALATASLLGFLSSSLMAGEIEGAGVQRESRLLAKEMKHAHVAHTLEHMATALNFNEQDHASIASVAYRIELSGSPDKDVMRKLLENLEVYSAAEQPSDLPEIPGEEAALPLIGPAVSRIKQARIKEEARTEAATNALVVALSESSAYGLEQVTGDSSRFAELLVGAIADVTGESSEDMIKRMCSLTLRVFSRPETAASESIPTAAVLIDRSAEEVSRGREVQSAKAERAREIEVHPMAR
jgi:hypothetical protein